MKTLKSMTVFAALFAAASLFAAQRVVVLELFTGTWCSYCPGAALGADDLVDAYPGQVLVVEYHSGTDTFVNDDGIARHLEFYGDYVPGMPTAVFDGVSIVTGGDTAASIFSTYDAVFTTRKDVEPVLEIGLEKTEGYLEQGTLTATVKNVSGSEITGRVIFTVTESAIPYQWKNQSELHFVERDMLPDQEGELITLSAGETLTVERNYDIGTGWPHYTGNLDNVEFGCFVQDTAAPTLLQSDTLPPGRLGEILGAAVLPAGGSTGVVERTTHSPISLDVPSIVSGLATLKVSVSAPSLVELNLFDAAGRRVTTIYSGRLETGTHLIDVATGDLAPGVYFVSMNPVGSSRIARRLIVM